MNEREIRKMRKDRLEWRLKVQKEKLIPLKPISVIVDTCPRCKEYLRGKPEKCPYCEQILDWSNK